MKQSLQSVGTIFAWEVFSRTPASDTFDEAMDAMFAFATSGAGFLVATGCVPLLIALILAASRRRSS
jgi:hypothetical protein